MYKYFNQRVNMGKQDDTTTRERILLAARREFAEKGFHGARLGEIAKQAHVNKALIHYYFGNKEELYENLIDRLFGIGRRKGIAIYTPKWNLTAGQKLYLMLYLHHELHKTGDQWERYRILFWEFAEGNRYHEKAIRESAIPMKNLLGGIIDEGIAQGEFDAVDQALLGRLVMSFQESHVVEREVFGNGPLYREFYGDRTEDDFFNFLVKSVFKILAPEGRPAQVPAMPEDVIRFMESMVDNLRRDIDEGYAQEAIQKIRQIILDKP